jgi:hypothetical protein
LSRCDHEECIIRPNHELYDASITPQNVLYPEISDAIITSLSLRVYRFLPSDLGLDRTVGDIDIYAFTTFPIEYHLMYVLMSEYQLPTTLPFSTIVKSYSPSIWFNSIRHTPVFAATSLIDFDLPLDVRYHTGFMPLLSSIPARLLDIRLNFILLLVVVEI